GPDVYARVDDWLHAARRHGMDPAVGHSDRELHSRVGARSRRPSSPARPPRVRRTRAMKAILGFIVTRRVTSSLGPTLVLSALVWLGSPQGAQAGINEWTSNGPYGGSVSVLVVDPQTPSTLYAGANGNGIYKSTDAGASWTN